jgi:hypothetical protein
VAGKLEVVGNKQVGGRELKMTRVKVLKKVSHRKVREPAQRVETTRSPWRDALQTTTTKLIASIDEALAAA